MQKETIIFSLSTFSSTYVNLLKIFFPFYSILTCDDDNKLANKEARLKILVTTISLKHSPTLLLIKLTTSSTEEFLFSASVLLLISWVFYRKLLTFVFIGGVMLLSMLVFKGIIVAHFGKLLKIFFCHYFKRFIWWLLLEKVNEKCAYCHCNKKYLTYC